MVNQKLCYFQIQSTLMNESEKFLKLVGENGLCFLLHEKFRPPALCPSLAALAKQITYRISDGTNHQGQIYVLLELSHNGNTLLTLSQTTILRLIQIETVCRRQFQI